MLWAPASVLAAAVHGVHALGRAGSHCSSGPWAVQTPPQCLGSSMPAQPCAHLQPWSLCHAISLCTQSWSPYPAGFPMCVHQQRWPLCHTSLPCACVPTGMVPVRCKPSVCMGPCSVQAFPVLMQLGLCFRGCVPPSTRTWGCHPALPKPPPWALTHGCQLCHDTAPCSPGPMLWWALQNPRPAVQRAVGPQ